MATTLTNPVATVTLAGTAERITLPSKYSWVWVRNDTEAAVYISQADDVGEGVSGSVAIPAGGAARLALTGDSFYAVGTGAVQAVAANYTDCPFKAAPAASGGGSESGGSCAFDGKLVQWGKCSVTNNTGSVIAFPVKYKTAPMMFTTAFHSASAAGYGVYLNNVTYQNFSIKAFEGSADGVKVTWSEAYWLAIGEPAEEAST